MSNYNISAMKSAIKTARRYNKLMVEFLRDDHKGAKRAAAQCKSFVKIFMAEARGHQMAQKLKDKKGASK